VSSLRRGLFAVSLFAGVYLALTPAAADAGEDGPPVRHVLLLAQAAGAVSADQAAALVRDASGGRILDVRLDEAAEPPVYRVKVLVDGGRVRVYRVDASTGRIVP
jgi:uncharacterized membrane protein YkoI